MYIVCASTGTSHPKVVNYEHAEKWISEAYAYTCTQATPKSKAASTCLVLHAHAGCIRVVTTHICDVQANASKI
jgi:hypothetical protein